MSDASRAVTALRYMFMHLARCVAVIGPVNVASGIVNDDRAWAIWAAASTVSSVALWVVLWLGEPAWVKQVSKP